MLPRWKSLLLGSYYYATCARRRRAIAAREAALRAPVMILFGHRVADQHPNDWTVSRAVFSRQIHWLKANFDLVTLSEAQARLRSGVNRRACVSLTFDDGYADNCEFALPLLAAERVPCTYFVATRFVLDARPFPHDVARGVPLAANTPAQLRALADSGVEIGCHTRSHADLGKISNPAELYEEIVVARHELEDLTGRAVRYFAFPFGLHRNLNRAAFELAREEGFEGVCSAYGGYNFPGDDPFHLQRIHLDDDLLRVKNWLTVDPRKLRAADRYDYRGVEHCRDESLLAEAGV